MSYLRIPESTIATVMSGQLGKAVGSVLSSAQKTLFELKDSLQSEVNSYYESVDKVNSSIASYNSEIASGNKTSADLTREKASIESSKKDLESKKNSFNSKLSIASSKLSSIEKQISRVSSLVATIKKLIKTLKVPVKALKVTVTVLKALPIPQMYLVVSVTVLYSDLLEMTLELIKQAEELCNALESVCTQIPAQLDSIKQIISDLKAWIATLKLSAEFTDLSEEDQKILEDAGLLDSKTGESLLSKLGKVAGGGSGGSSSNTPAFVTFGECSTAFTDSENIAEAEKLQTAVNSTVFVNKLAEAKPGDEIKQIVSSVGDCKVSLYKAGSVNSSGAGTSNSLVVSTELNSTEVPKGWSTQPVLGVDNIKAEAIISGITGKVKGSWSMQTVTAEEIEQENLNREGTELKQGDSFIDTLFETITIPVLDSSKLTNLKDKSGVLKVGSVESLLGQIANTLSELPLSVDLKNKLNSYILDLKIDQEGENSETVRVFDYLASTGETYSIEILDDLQYSTLAVRHYAVVKDSKGIIVLEGPKTFSLNTAILVTDIENRLEQTLG